MKVGLIIIFVLIAGVIIASGCTQPASKQGIPHSCGEDVNCIRDFLKAQSGCPTNCKTSEAMADAKLKPGFVAVCGENCEGTACFYCCSSASCYKDACGITQYTHEVSSCLDSR